MMSIKDTYALQTDPKVVTDILFNGNINEGGGYKGILLQAYWDEKNIYMDVYVKVPIKLYGYSHLYSDMGGNSGKAVRVQKYNKKELEDYKIFNTNVSGNRYEMGTLEPGKYKFTAENNYITFDEWEVEEIK